MKRLPRVIVISLSLLASVAYILEGRPRIALWRAGFSHQTYRSGFVSLLRTEIKCSDRNPSLKGWIDCFPRLERLHLVAGGDNSNHFDSLLPFTRITSLRELELAGVSLGSVDEIPAFPLLEELRLYESTCMQSPNWTSGCVLRRASRPEMFSAGCPSIREKASSRYRRDAGRAISSFRARWLPTLPLEISSMI